MTTALRPSAQVLVVDDDGAVLDSLARALASEGFEVLTARSAAEGLNCFTQKNPDIVLLDLSMPEGNGWDAYEQMSRCAPLVPVVIITARPGQLGVARAAGVGALVEKPIEIPALVATMHRLLGEDPGTRLARLARQTPATRVVPPAGTARATWRQRFAGWNPGTMQS